MDRCSSGFAASRGFGGGPACAIPILAGADHSRERPPYLRSPFSLSMSSPPPLSPSLKWLMPAADLKHGMQLRRGGLHRGILRLISAEASTTRAAAVGGTKPGRGGGGHRW
jgi:hypothetical protein